MPNNEQPIHSTRRYTQLIPQTQSAESNCRLSFEWGSPPMKKITVKKTHFYLAL